MFKKILGINKYKYAKKNGKIKLIMFANITLLLFIKKKETSDDSTNFKLLLAIKFVDFIL